jgi:hypothetical protein
LKNVGLRDARIEPLDVELMPLIGRIRRHAKLYVDSRVLAGEPRQLALDDRTFGAERAAREGQSRARLSSAAAEDRGGQRHDESCSQVKGHRSKVRSKDR